MVRAGSKAVARYYASREEAEAVVKDALKALDGGIAATDAVDKYAAHLGSTDVKASTVTTARFRLVAALKPVSSMPVSVLSARAGAVYEALTAKYSAQTHRSTLSELKRFGGWLHAEGYLKANPFTRVQPVGRINRGKPQLRVLEARRLVEVCAREVAAGDVSALQPLLCLLMALRAGEVAGLQVRDVDDDGKLLWVAQVQHKTAASKRMLEVPALLQGPLSRLAANRATEDQLIPGSTRFTVLWHTKRLCKLAGVPVVSAHGLRGTHATLATRAGATAELVMTALGHANTAVGAAHYIQPAATHSTRSDTVSRRLQK